MTKSFLPNVAIAAILLLGPTAKAASPGTVAPIPAQLLTAKSVFISNAGYKCFARRAALNPCSSDLLYNQVYPAMKTWGRYQLAPTPAEADLALELKFVLAESPSTSSFILTVRDPKTHVPLWSFTEYSQPAGRSETMNNHEISAMNQLVTDLKILVTPPENPTK